MSGAEPVTAAWLTGVLARAGVLPPGSVAAVAQRPTSAFNSHTSYLVVTYTPDAPPNAPARLVLKRSRPVAWAVEAGAREVAFYRTAARRADLPMIVRCYAAEVDAATGASFLVLEDLSATHHLALTREQQLCPGTAVPAAAVCDQAVDLLGAFHAAWWSHPDLGREPAAVGRWYRNRAGWETYMRRRAGAWAALLADEGAWYPADLRDLYEYVLARFPSVWDRCLAPRLATFAGVTLTHGDAYFANMLCPNDPAGQAYLIDWQSPEAYLGASDLVNLMATFWTPAQRAAAGREERLLGRYHAALQAGGVTGYAWSDLLVDYRLALIEWLLAPLQDRADGAGRDYWWPKMQCLAGAVRDHRCVDLLAG